MQLNGCTLDPYEWCFLFMTFALFFCTFATVGDLAM